MGFLGSGKDFAEMWEQFQREQRAEKALKDASTDDLLRIWEAWDGVEVMKVGGVYIPDSWMHQELKKRGAKIDP